MLGRCAGKCHGSTLIPSSASNKKQEEKNSNLDLRYFENEEEPFMKNHSNTDVPN